MDCTTGLRPRQAADRPGGVENYDDEGTRLLRSDLPARVGRTRPRWWLELLLLGLTYRVYAGIRNHQGNDTSTAALSRALANAGHLVRLERALGLYHELALQQLFLGMPLVVRAFDVFYATAHVTVTAAVLLWVYVRHPAGYRRARTALVLSTATGLVVFALFPTAPPRLLPNAGFVDALGRIGGLWSFHTPAIEHIANPFAAMPSLHLVWGTWCALAVLSMCRRRVMRAIAAAYPLTVTLVVVATANHFLVDVVSGAVLAAVAWKVCRVPERVPQGRRPVDDETTGDRAEVLVEQEAAEPVLAGVGFG